MGGFSGGRVEGAGGVPRRDGSARALEELHFSQLMWRYQQAASSLARPRASTSVIKTQSVKDPRFCRQITPGKHSAFDFFLTGTFSERWKRLSSHLDPAGYVTPNRNCDCFFYAESDAVD